MVGRQAVDRRQDRRRQAVGVVLAAVGTGRALRVAGRHLRRRRRRVGVAARGADARGPARGAAARGPARGAARGPAHLLLRRLHHLLVLAASVLEPDFHLKTHPTTIDSLMIRIK